MNSSSGSFTVTLPARSTMTFVTSMAGTGTGGGTETCKLVNVATGLVLGVKEMSKADGGLALVWSDSGTADHRWSLVANSDGSHRIRNVNSGKVLAILNGSSAVGTQAVQVSDNGSAKNNWRLVKVG